MAYIHSDGSDDGPVVKVTGASQPPATEADRIRAEADQLYAKADACGNLDRRLADGYRQRARHLLSKLDQTAEPTQ